MTILAFSAPPDSELAVSSPDPGIERMRFLDREVSALLSDLEG